MSALGFWHSTCLMPAEIERDSDRAPIPVIDDRRDMNPAPTASRVGVNDGPIELPVRSLAIVIIEDVADARKTLGRLLALDGHDVREAADGYQGLHALLSQPADVALVDIGLPGLDGYEIARIARNNSALDRVRLVALTGHGRPEDRENIMAAGFDNHLVKPVSAAELLRVLRPRDT